MSKADENYKAIKQHAHYTNLSSVNQSLVSKFESQNSLKSDTYFVYGTYIDENKVSMDVVTGYFVTVMQKYFTFYVDLKNLMYLFITTISILVMALTVSKTCLASCLSNISLICKPYIW